MHEINIHTNTFSRVPTGSWATVRILWGSLNIRGVDKDNYSRASDVIGYDLLVCAWACFLWLSCLGTNQGCDLMCSRHKSSAW